jgi:hypothetical protein
MPISREELSTQIGELIDCVERLTMVLQEYKEANVTLDALIADGTPTIEALERAGAPRARPELTDALDQFAGTRHSVRLALLTRAIEEGASMADAGRAFSLSRQLVSRMIAEHQQESNQSQS